MPHRKAIFDQQGFSLVSAIFLLVTLSALGVFMVRMVTVQHVTVAQDIQGIRAYQAARAGLEWGIFRTGIPSGTKGTTCPNGTAASTTTLPALSADLAGFTVTVTCRAQQYSENEANDLTIFTITSTAASGAIGTPERVERRLEVRI
jgi:MSHA biogenesis protein MshP